MEWQIISQDVRYLVLRADLRSSLEVCSLKSLPYWLKDGIHGLSQQGIWVSFWTLKPLKNTPQDTRISLWGNSWNVNFKHMIKCVQLHINPMTLYKDTMPYFDNFIHVYNWNLNILWSPFKIWTPQNFTIANLFIIEIWIYCGPLSKFGRPQILQLPILGT